MLHNNSQATVKTDVIINQSVQNSIDNNKAEIDKINQSLQGQSADINLSTSGTMTLTKQGSMVTGSFYNATLSPNLTIQIASSFSPDKTVIGNFMATVNQDNYLVNFQLVSGQMTITSINDLTGQSQTSLSDVNGTFNYQM